MRRRDTAPLTPEQRTSRAKIAAGVRWTKEVDPVTATQPARDGLIARFEREVDPDGVLAPEVRYTKALRLRQAHMRSLALKSSKARAAKRASA